MTIAFPSNVQLTISDLSALFFSNGEQIIPRNTYNMDGIELGVRKYVVSLTKKALSVEFDSSSSMQIGSLITLSDAKASLKRSDGGKWSFVIKGGYRVGNSSSFSVDTSLKADGNLYRISSQSSSVRYGILMNMIDTRNQIKMHTEQMNMKEFVIDNFQITGTLGSRNTVR